MGNPFSTTTPINYNTNPPSDDGAQTTTNRIQWSTQKVKLSDPVYNAFNTSETNTNTAFGKIIGGAGVTTTAVDYGMTASDQGRFIKVTVAAKTVTTPDATIVGSPFVFCVVNQSNGNITLAGNNPGVQQKVDGANSITLVPNTGVMVNTDGSNWFTNGTGFNATAGTGLTLSGNVLSVTLPAKNPTFQTFTTGTAATYTTPAGATMLRVKMVGGGGGGAAKATNAGSNGGDTIFGTTTAIHGNGGAVGSNGGGTGGTGGVTTTGTLLIRVDGQKGGSGWNNGTNAALGGTGGNSIYGGGGQPGSGATAGGAAAANSGSGGAGGGDAGGSSSSGGGAGEYVEFYITSPAGTYTYTVGALGAGGTAGTNAGGNGAAGRILVEEYYS